jgi:hypothetical protein
MSKNLVISVYNFFPPLLFLGFSSGTAIGFIFLGGAASYILLNLFMISS